MTTPSEIYKTLRRKKSLGQHVSNRLMKNLYAAYFEAKKARAQEGRRITLEEERIALEEKGLTQRMKEAEDIRISRERGLDIAEEEAETAKDVATIQGITNIGMLSYIARKPIAKGVKATTGFLKGAFAPKTTTSAITGTAAGADVAGTGAIGADVAGTGTGAVTSMIAPIAGGMIGGKIGGDIAASSKTVKSITPWGGEETERKLGGMATGAAIGGVIGGPVGAVVGGAAGALADPIMDFISDPCIIVTACHGKDSEEVNITREYRDNFLNKDTLRGYYMLAEQLVPYMKSNEEYKKYIKNNFVNHFIEVGKYRLGKVIEKPSDESINITDGFLNVCNIIGKSVDSFTRLNKEVI
jgi:hypothetical protein